MNTKRQVFLVLIDILCIFQRVLNDNRNKHCDLKLCMLLETIFSIDNPKMFIQLAEAYKINQKLKYKWLKIEYFKPLSTNF